MRVRLRAAAMVMVAGFLAGLVGVSPANAQENEADKAARKRFLEGTHVFRRILLDNDIQSLGGFPALTNDPEKSILIVLGAPDAIARVEGGLARFVEGGGALLLASDQAFHNPEASNSLLRLAGVSISNLTLKCPDSELCYLGLDYCPRLQPAPDAKPWLFSRGGHRARPEGTTSFFDVATNVPSQLDVIPRLPRNVRPLAYLPASCEFEERGARRRQRGSPLFAVGGEVGKGRLLILADHSIFINEMMLPDTNRNVEFTEECINWLRGPDRSRDRALFVENGKVETNFSIPLRPGNISAEQALKFIVERRNELLAEAEQGIARLEDDDFFNRKLLDVLDAFGLTPARLMWLLAVFGTIALVFYLVYRLGVRDRFRHDPSVPLLTGAVARGLPAGPLLEQRNAEVLRQGNLGEPATYLTRRWFERLGLEEAGGAAPAFEVQGGWWQRRRMRARLARLWDLSSGRSAERVSAPQMWRLQRELDQLRSAWERGAWRIVGPA